MNEYGNRNGKRRIGWLCSYVPEELIMAAGLEPVRVVGRVGKIEEADAYMFPNFCPYLKGILDSGLRNLLEDIEGIIFTNSCDGMRRLYDVWNNYLEMPFTYMLEVPKNRDEAALRYFSEQIAGLKVGLEEAFEVNISDGRLDWAIAAMNHRRASVMELFEGQKAPRPPLKGSELLTLCLEEMTRPKGSTTGKLECLAERPNAFVCSRPRHPRILVIGNRVDRPDLFQMVEAAGASVVVFDTCLGLGHYSGFVENGGDPVEEIARRYLLKPPCARMPGLDKRIERVERLVQDYSIDGIIYSNLKFCDYGLFDAPVIESGLGDRTMPFLTLDNDYFWGDKGRVKTRIEAFVETIETETT